MSVTVIQKPTSGAVYARNTVPSLIVEANEGVYVKIIYRSPLDEEWELSNVLFEGTYTPDFDGRVSVDFMELYDTFVNTQFPLTSGNILRQDAYWYHFNIIWEGISTNTGSNVVFKVANAILNSSTAFGSWTGQNFLTNQPVEKRTTEDAPEWLTWFDGSQGDLVLKVRWYPKAGGNYDVTVFTENASDYQDYGALCYTVNVSYSRLIKMATYLPGQLYGYYDLMLLNRKGVALCKQRYIYEERTGREKYFLFVNALGGIDTLVCHGDNALQPELTLNVGRFDRQYKALDDADNVRQWTQQTGQMPSRWRDWLYELMATRQGAWKYEDGTYIPIVVTSSEIAMGDTGQLASAAFGYRYAETTRAISDSDRAKDRSFHKSVAQQAQAFDDMTVSAILEFSPSQGGGYETEALAIPSSQVYITWEGNQSIYVLVNGQLHSEYDSSAVRMPVVIDIDPGDEVSFSSQDVITTITVNYYPDRSYLAQQTQSANQQTQS